MPPAAWPARLESLPPPTDLPDDLIRQSEAETQAVLSTPELAWIFAADTLAEVTVSGQIKGKDVMGLIDRLIVTERKITVVDYKTNLTVPEVPEQTPEAILRQMGAYAALLREIYPGREIETGILWTRTATYMTLPHLLVNEALERAPKLDAGLPGS